MSSGEDCERSVSRWWSDLCADLLDLIVKKLTRASDYLRFRCVCRYWRSVAKRANLPPHLPLLMLPYDPSTERRSVLSVSTKQIHTLCIPELVNKIILAASRGWLLLLDVAPADGRLFLLNPLTGAEIQLPPTDSFFHLRGYEFSPVHQKFQSINDDSIDDSIDDSTLDLLQYSRIFPWRAFLLSSPNTAPMDCMVVITSCYPSISDIAFCKLGDKSWTLINTRLLSLPISVVHHEGSLYMTDLKSNCWIYEIGSISSPPIMIGMPSQTVQFFVATSSQLLMFSGVFPRLLSSHPYLDLEESYKNRYWIYEFFPKNQSRTWRLSLVKSLLNKPRFRSWFLYQNFIVCTKNISGCQEDCIYVDVSEPGVLYAHEIDDDAHEIDDDAFKIDVLNLKTGNYEHLSCGQKEPHSRKLLHSVWVELSL